MSRTGNLTNQTPRMRVLRMIRTNIDSGNWKPGEKIPTEQQLAQELRTSRETVRAALAQAETEGLIINLRKQGGRGRVVAEPHQKVEDSLLGCVIVLITGYRRPVGGHESGGNEHLLNAGVYECAQQHDFHVLSVYGHSLNERKLDQLIDARPFGVIADVAMSSHPNIDRY
ncbi:MAG: GntR family transcriptional regulator, partial [Lentisphaerae bacterium]